MHYIYADADSDSQLALTLTLTSVTSTVSLPFTVLLYECSSVICIIAIPILHLIPNDMRKPKLANSEV